MRDDVANKLSFAVFLFTGINSAPQISTAIVVYFF